jgi:tetratricopeptide (TPR) repeat protein
MRNLKHSLFIILLFFSIFCKSIAQDAIQPNTLFFQGNSFYKDERYSEAIKVYEQLVAMGVKSGHLYYNLGNAYFKNGNKGKAILNYERALQLLPRDADVKSNLDYALSLVEGNPTPRDSNWFLSKIFVLERLLNINELTIVVFLLYFGLMAILIFSILLKSLRRILYYTAAILVLLLLFSLISFSVELYKTEFQQKAVIIPENVDVRFEPSDDATLYFTLHEGAVIEVTKFHKDWSKIRRWDGKAGWVKNDSFELVAHIRDHLKTGAGN